MQDAPFYSDVAEGPAGGIARWITASDGIKLRIAAWPEGSHGTVLLFPGRTEYVEKYGRAAADLKSRGFATLAIDWRGQGLADRMLADRGVGHVVNFQDYQLDVAAAVKAAEQLELPRPYYLIAHSMGGAIGLRALMNGLGVKAAAFSAPMWGIEMAPMTRPFAWVLSTLAAGIGQGHHLSPGTKKETYVVAEPFEDNFLTTDPEMFDYMSRQIAADAALALGGPSLRWLNQALRECRDMSLSPAPTLPCYTAVGTEEKIVDVSAITAKMSAWRGGTLETVLGAEHEIMIEVPATRNAFFDATTELFKAHP